MQPPETHITKTTKREKEDAKIHATFYEKKQKRKRPRRRTEKTGQEQERKT